MMERLVMKKIFIALFMMMTIVPGCYAQLGSGHLTFMGIPIDGNPEVFAKKLQKKGFKAVKNTPHGKTFDIMEFRGTFASIPNCNVTVVSGLNTVTMVMVSSVHKNWKDLESTFSSLNGKLSLKYCNFYPETSEGFTCNPSPETEEDKLAAVKEGCCDYKTVIKTSEGIIALTICWNKDKNVPNIMILYGDMQNFLKPGRVKSGIDDL